MKRIGLLLLAIICSILFLNAQNYQTVRSGRVSLFSDAPGYIKCIRIDSVAFQTDSILFPPPNILQVGLNCFNPKGNSWIGEKVIIQEDGTNLFFNNSNDTIRLKTKARVNDSWTAYELKDYIKIIAEIKSVDTLSVLGELDSVKTIGFRVFDKNGVSKAHYLNDKTLILSKNHGFVRIMNFREFPNVPNARAFEILETFNLIGLTNPDLGVQNLTRLRVYDFNSGDELHTLYEWSECCNKGDTTKIMTKLKYLERQDAKDSVVYTVERKQSIFKRIGIKDSISYEVVHDTIIQVYKPDSLFDILPGEPIISDRNTFTYIMLNEDPVSKRDDSMLNNIIMSNDTCGYKIAGEACFRILTYVKGLGGTYFSCINPEGAGGGESFQLVYYKKGSTTWGTPLVITDVKSLGKEDQVIIYPNPASDFIMLQNTSGREEKYVLQLMDMQGREVLRNSITLSSSYYRLDLSSLPGGAYLLKLQNGENQISRMIVKKQ